MMMEIGNLINLQNSMTYFNRFCSSVSLFVTLCLFIGCNNFNSDNYYKAGGLVALDYPIQTNLKYKIIRQYLDTLRIIYGYSVPEKWNDKQKIVDLDNNNKIIYFKNK